MKSSRTGGLRIGENKLQALRFAYRLLFAFIIVRIFLNANILDLWLNYTAEQGSPVEKIHPGSYGLIALSMLALMTLRIELAAAEVRIVRALVALLTTLGLLSVLMAATGHVGSAGYLVDSYAVACVTGIVLFAFPPAWRERIATTILAALVASSVVAVVEVVLKVRLLPYPAQELTFRPTGLMEHPLLLGLGNAAAIGFTAATRWSARTKFLAIATLLLGAVAAGARLAMLAAAASALLCALMAEWPSVPPRQRAQLKALVLIGAVLIVPVLVAALASFGLLDRFREGLFDESAMARVSIYGLFELVGWKDILLGTDIAAVRKLAFERFGLEFIESALVIFVFQFGLIGTVLFLGVLVHVLRTMLRGAGRYVTLGTVTFVVVATGNNTLSVKTPAVLMLFVLIIALRRSAYAPAPTDRRGGWA